MTRSEDKLMAISGLSRLVGSKIDDTYLAGLWFYNNAVLS